MQARARRTYPSDLSDLQWAVIEDLIPHASAGGRPRSTDVREVVNAIFYLNRTGCAWRYLPDGFPRWRTVYDYFAKWKTRGIWNRIHDQIRGFLRIKSSKAEVTSTLIVDSQSIRAHYGEDRGYDGYKRLRGRKRHILVDTLGFIHSVQVHGANLNDGRMGRELFKQLSSENISSLKAVYADSAYRGMFTDHVQARFGFYATTPELRKDTGQGRRTTTAEKKANRKLRNLGPKRWIVERTFAWFNHYRRLSRDYERKTSHSESMIQIAMTCLMLKRLVPV